jgi:hypothetical protein
MYLHNVLQNTDETTNSNTFRLLERCSFNAINKVRIYWAVFSVIKPCLLLHVQRYHLLKTWLPRPYGV